MSHTSFQQATSMGGIATASGNGAATHPRSAVTTAIGLVGFAGLVCGLALAVILQPPLWMQTAIVLFSCALPMALWAIVAERAPESQSSGLNLSARNSRASSLANLRVKIIGLWGTWGVLLFLYWLLNAFTSAGYEFFFTLLKTFGPPIALLSAPYLYFVDRRQVKQHDELWHAGLFFLGRWDRLDRAELADHARAWAVKGFFLSFMLSIMPTMVGRVTGAEAVEIFSGIVPFTFWLIALLFLIDVTFGTVGYLMTSRYLDSHIRRANPYLSAWIAALICYPPFTLMSAGGPLNYHTGIQDWSVWLAEMPALLVLWSIILVLLTGLYAWATMIFGLRFSNLTHRGIITNGPYRYFKHPAYLAKGTFWWFASMPFLSTAGPEQGLRNALLLGVVCVVYFWRAKTEEKQLMADPDYQVYSAWIAEHGVLAKLRRNLAGQ